MPDSTPNPSDNGADGEGAAPRANPALGFAGDRPVPAARRPPGAVGSWARQHFTREQVVNAFKTLLWVAPLTLLIWVYAERAELRQEDHVIIPIEVATNDPNRVVTLENPKSNDALIMATLSGPQAGVDAVNRNLDPHYGGGPVRVDIDRALGTGPQHIDASRVGNDPRFVSRGVTVAGCQPAWLDVYIDPVVEVPVPVREPDKLPNVGAVTFTPAEVRVRGPERVLNALRKSDQLYAAANLAGRPELAAAGGPPDHPISLPNVKLTLPVEGRNVTLVGPALVQADVSFKAGRELLLRAVPLQASAPSDVTDPYKIVYDKTLLDVTVVGPEEKIEQLTRPDFSPKPRATFEVTTDDVGGPKTVPVEFKLPPGVTYKSGPSTVTFRLVPRGSGE